jgi:peroxiredoxin
MRSNVRTLSTLGLTAAALALAGTLASAGQATQSKKATLGEKVPAFTLKDLDGKEVKLADYKGKVVVLQWTNPDCPFIQGCYKAGIAKETVKQMKTMGDNYVFMAINSTAVGPKGDVTREAVIEQTRGFMKTHELDFKVLIDHDGTVARAYDARTTPHVFVIDGEGILRYHGAFTEDSTFKKADATNYVLNALKQMKAGETVSPDYVKPWGCPVKPKAEAKGG